MGNKRSLRPVVQYFGGKFKLAPWIIEHFPKHWAYTEAFGGGANVLLRKPRSAVEVYNDLDSQVVNVFRVLRDPQLSSELQRLLDLTPWSRDEFNAAHTPTMDMVEQARRLLVKAAMGRGSDAVTRDKNKGFRGSAKKGSPHYANEWATFHEFIPVFHQRFKGVIVKNDHAFDVLQSHDASDTLHYVDPPYVHATRGDKNNYRYELTDADHRNLADVLHGLTGMVVLSGYDSDLYKELYADWKQITYPTHADGYLSRVECLWINPSASKHQLSFDV